VQKVRNIEAGCTESSNKKTNRTENTSVQILKAKSKLRWVTQVPIAAGYHEPLYGTFKH
jgi:hypothetical protein